MSQLIAHDEAPAAARARRAPRLNQWLISLITYSLMLILAFGFVTPFVFMLVGSLKQRDRVLAEGNTWRAFVPTTITFENFGEAIRRASFDRLLLNSLIITGATVIGGLVVNSLFGYALARFRFAGRGLLLAFVIALIIIPLEAYAIPMLYVMAQLGWTDTYHAQILPFIANPFYIYLFYNFFLGLPRELEEAAEIDGAGSWTIFLRVAVPLARPAFATVAILSFLASWGQLFWPIMVTHGPEVRPLALGIAEFQTQQPLDWGAIMAFATLMTIPTLLVFLIFQQAFVRGVARSGLKG